MSLARRRSILSAENPKSIAAQAAFWLLWCAIAGWIFRGAAYQAGDILDSVIAGAFVLLGIVMLVRAARMALDYAKFGPVRLVLLGELPAVGGRLDAQVEFMERASVPGTIGAELVCLSVKYQLGGEGDSCASEEVAWSGKRQVPVLRHTAVGTAPVHFDIPAGLAATEIPGEDGVESKIDFHRTYWKWQLRIAADVAGLDLARSFDVRVRRRALKTAGDSRASPRGWMPAAGRPAAGASPVVVRGSGENASPKSRARWRRALAFAGAVAAMFAALAMVLHDPDETRSTPERDSTRAGVEASQSSGAPGFVDLRVGPEATEFVSPATGDAMNRLGAALLELNAGRHAKAARMLQETLSAVERDHGEGSPMAALVHYWISRLHQEQKNLAGQEASLSRALAILERYPDAEVKRTPGLRDTMVDVSQVAADLGYIYWEWRRYEDAYAHYERAHDAAPALSTTEYNRNRLLAISSAGLMASACTLGKWEVADRAMAELKERMARVDADLRDWLAYWVRTGEPRLQARRC